MLRVVSFNANGIRAAARKGFFEWFESMGIDILCIQETKAQENQLEDPVFHPKGYHRYFFDAEKKGYSGVAIYSKKEPKKVTTGLGWEIADTEGRYIEAEFDDVVVASLYLPSGTSGDIRQEYKYEFLDNYLQILKKQSKSKKPYIICGDWNIAHTRIDIKNDKANEKNSGFLPEERAWLDTLFHEVGFVDSFRQKHPEKIQYTWWSQRAKAWDNNVGWRIDYQVVSPSLKDSILDASVYREEKFSDHAPLIHDYDLTF